MLVSLIYIFLHKAGEKLINLSIKPPKRDQTKDCMPGIYTAGGNNKRYSAKNIDFTEITTHCFDIITIRNNAQVFYIFYSQKKN